MTVEGCGSESLQGDVRFAEVMGLMGAQVQWAPYSITITGAPSSRASLTSNFWACCCAQWAVLVFWKVLLRIPSCVVVRVRSHPPCMRYETGIGVPLP